MKTVCYIAKSFPNKSETFVISQITSAIEKGYNVLVLTYNIRDIDNSSQKLLFSKYNILETIRKIDFKIPNNKVLKALRLVVLYSKYFKYLFNNASVPLKQRLLQLPFKINFFERFKNVNTFHIQFGNAGFDLILMKKIGYIKSRCIVTFHGIDAHCNDEADFNNKKRIYKDVFEYSDVITCNSNYLKKKLLLLGCPIEKINIIPMGVDTSFFFSKTKVNKSISEPFKLVSVGRLIELKGHDFAIKAVEKLVSQGYNIEYNIIGNGVRYDFLCKLILELNLVNNVILHGFKTQTEIKEIYTNSVLFLMSSITDASGRGEAQGLVTAEAQAMGIPVVAFNSGGVSETIINNKTGILVNEKNIDDFAIAIKKILDNDVLRIEMGKQAKMFINDSFNLKRNSELFFKLY